MTIPLVGVTTPWKTVPYISVDMFKYHARRGVSVAGLMPGADDASQDAALAGYIEQGSDWVDLNAEQTFAASFDTETRTASTDRYGQLKVYPRFRPVIALTALSAGYPGHLSELDGLSGTVEPNSFTVGMAPASTLTSSEGPLQFGIATGPWSDVTVTYTYVHGYPITYLTADVEASGTTLEVLDTTGIVAGQTFMTIYAGKQRHRTLITGVSTSVTDSSPALGAGGPGTLTVAAVPFDIRSNSETGYPTMISALPSSLIDASVLATRAHIKGVSAGNVSAQSAASSATTGGKGPQNSGDDLAMAWGIISRHLNPNAVMR